MLNLRRIVASAYAVEKRSSMVGDDLRVDDCGRSCTTGIRKSRTIRLSLHITIMQDRHDLI